MGGSIDKLFGAKDADAEDLSGGQIGARAGAGALAGGLKAAGQTPKQGGGGAPIQVPATPDVSGYYPQRPLTPYPGEMPQPNPMFPRRDPNDPYAAFQGR